MHACIYIYTLHIHTYVNTFIHTCMHAFIHYIYIHMCTYNTLLVCINVILLEFVLYTQPKLYIYKTTYINTRPLPLPYISTQDHYYHYHIYQHKTITIVPLPHINTRPLLPLPHISTQDHYYSTTTTYQHKTTITTTTTYISTQDHYYSTTTTYINTRPLL